MQTPDHNENLDLSAPPPLVAELRRVSQAPDLFIPRTVDEAVLRAARKHLEPPAKAQFGWRWWVIGGSTATAAIAIAFALWLRPNPALAREDLNRDGQVDVVDALVLAQAAREGKGGPDLNGDGRVDEQDAAVVADTAVQLHPGT